VISPAKEKGPTGLFPRLRRKKRRKFIHSHGEGEFLHCQWCRTRGGSPRSAPPERGKRKNLHTERGEKGLVFFGRLSPGLKRKVFFVERRVAS